MMSIIKKSFVEMLGTMTLSLVVLLLVITKSAAAIPMAVALALALSYAMYGSISGGFFNPALTVAAGIFRKISATAMASYLVAQFIGAGVAYVVVELFTLKVSVAQLLAPIIAAQSVSPAIGFVEALGMFFFAMAVVAAMHNRVSDSFKPVLVGGGLFLGIAIASATGSAAILNPAIALSIGFFNPVYVLGPIIGAIVAFALGNFVYSNK